jgi:cysteine synthase
MAQVSRPPRPECHVENQRLHSAGRLLIEHGHVESVCCVGHQIEGIGIGFVPPLWEPNLVNEIEAVTSSDAKSMARRLAREEGIFSGTSSGANAVAAIRVAQRLGPGATVVALMCDSGLRDLSTDLYRQQ